MYKIFGWINVAIVVVMISPFILRWLRSHVFKSQGAGLAKMIKTLHGLHKILGGLLLVSAIVHGFLALGAWRIHTGTILGLTAGAAAVFALLFYLFKKKYLFITHKVIAAVLILLVLVHLIFPSAIYYIFGV